MQRNKGILQSTMFIFHTNTPQSHSYQSPESNILSKSSIITCVGRLLSEKSKGKKVLDDLIVRQLTIWRHCCLKCLRTLNINCRENINTTKLSVTYSYFCQLYFPRVSPCINKIQELDQRFFQRFLKSCPVTFFLSSVIINCWNCCDLM